MKKTLCTAGVLSMLALPGAAIAQDETPSPKQTAQAACKAERAEVGKAQYRLTYGTANKNRTNAHRNCVRQRTGEVEATTAEAKTTCKDEQAADRAAFNEKYGTNKNKKNAYGKCVSAQVKAETEETTEERVAASKACRDERAADKAAFNEKYGTNKNKKNAMGKCVSATAKAMHEEEAPEETPEAAPTA